MRKNTPKTPLLQILREMTADQRKEFALRAGTSVSYIYQVAGCNRLSCRASLSKGLADASIEMNRLYGTPTITMETLATMCPLPEVVA